MIFVEDVKVREVCGSYCSVSRLVNPASVELTHEPLFEIEHINGERFVNARGETVCIGMAKQVRDAIGLPFESFSNMNKELDSLRASFASHVRQIKDLSATLAVSTTKLDAASSASLWKRIRYVFTKRLP